MILRIFGPAAERPVRPLRSNFPAKPAGTGQERPGTGRGRTAPNGMAAPNETAAIGRRRPAKREWPKPDENSNKRTDMRPDASIAHRPEPSGSSRELSGPGEA